ncbi:MAG: ABC transporter permease subunit, partial [Bdellovibrionales bacterium]|nr:ABC transporter permease subunit [Bdellovibrionales bacterium]
MKRSLNEFLFIGFLSFPFFILLFHIQNLQIPVGWDWFGVLSYSLLQAGLSAAISLFFGFLGALGLLKIKSQKIFRFFEWVLLLPAFVPQVVIISSVLTIITPLKLEFRGLMPVIFIHIIMNAGMCAVAIERVFQTKLKECMDLATLDGVRRWIFHWKVSIPMLIGELKILFAMVFAFCITSFGVPLLVGSSKMSLEVLIYEKMKLNHNWSEAILLAFIQMFLILFLLWPLGKTKSENFKEAWSRTSAFGVLGGILPLLLFTGMVFIGLVWGVEQGVHA